MNPQKLYKLKDGEYENTEVVYCEKCGTLYGGRNMNRSMAWEQAAQCCNHTCVKCGKEEISRYQTLCDECRRENQDQKEKDHWMSIPKIKIEECILDVYADEDKYYFGSDDLLERLEEDCFFYLEKNPDATSYDPHIYICDTNTFYPIDLMEQINSHYEDYMCEDIEVEDILDGNSLDIISDANEKFNELNKDKIMSYMIDKSTGIDLSEYTAKWVREIKEEKQNAL